MIEALENQFTKYELARILGARALQLAMDAPILLKIDKEKLEEINYDVLRIAELELESDVLPITVKRPFPKKASDKLKKIEKEEKKETGEEEKVEELEEKEEQEIKEEGEIMELAKPEDELEAEEEVESGEEV